MSKKTVVTCRLLLDNDWVPVSGDCKDSILGGRLRTECVLAVREKVVLEQGIHYPVMDTSFEYLGDER